MKQSSLYIDLFNTAPDYQSSNQRLLYCQLFIAVYLWSKDIKTDQSEIALQIFDKNLFDYVRQFVDFAHGVWKNISKNLWNGLFLYSKHNDSALSTLILETVINFRSLSSILNTISTAAEQLSTTSTSTSTCLLSQEIDSKMDSLLSFKHHTVATRAKCAELVSLSLCEASFLTLFSNKNTSESPYKGLISYSAQTIKEAMRTGVLDEDSGSNIIWAIIPGIGSFIKFSAFLSPNYSIWGLTLLIDLWVRIATQPQPGDGCEKSLGVEILEKLLTEEMYSLGTRKVSLALHLVLNEPFRAIDSIIRIFSDQEQSHRLMIDFIDRILKCPDKYIFLAAFSKVLTSSFVLAQDSSGFKSFLQFIKTVDGDANDTASSLLDDHLIYYRLLSSNSTQKKSVEELIKGGFYEILTSAYKSFDYSINHQIFSSASTYQKLLLLLVVDNLSFFTLKT